jgi:hypothetical protein
MRMRVWLAVAVTLLVAACGGDDNKAPPGFTRLTLRNPVWDRVDVDLVITRSTDCNTRSAGFVSERAIVMKKDAMERVDVPDGAVLCWRHDRNPKAPIAGDWSGWSKISLYPGQPYAIDL